MTYCFGAPARLPLALGLGFLCSALSGCQKTAGVQAQSAPPRVRFVHPVQAQITDYEYFSGRMEAVDSLEVRARVTGYLTKIHFKDGTLVKVNDPLFTIDPRPYQALFDQAKAQIQLADAKLKLARADYERGKAVAKTPGAISVQELETFAAAQAQAEAALEAVKAEAESADLNLKFTEVTASITGLIGRPLITEGNLVAQDSTLLTTIVSQDPIYCYFDVNERTMLRFQDLIRQGKIKSARENGSAIHVQIGTAADRDVYPYDGKINYVANQVEKSTGTIQLRAEFENSMAEGTTLRRFAPGMFVKVRVPVGPEHPALVVPQAAIGTDQGRKFLFVVGAGEKVEYRPIEAGAVQPDGMQAVLPLKIVREKEGLRLAEGSETGEDSLTTADRVIAGGLQRVRQGMIVNPQPTAAEGMPSRPLTSPEPAAASPTATAAPPPTGK